MLKRITAGALALCLCVSLFSTALAEGENWARIFRDPETLLYGLMDNENFSILLPAEYHSIWGFQDGTTIVHKNTETGSVYGLVDYKGNFILPMEYDELSRGDSDDSDNILRASRIGEDFYRYLRPDGTPLTDYTFAECSDFCRNIGVGCRSIGGKELYGAVNAQGEVLIPFEYDALDSPSPSYYGFDWLTAEKDGCYGAFDYNGNLFRRCIYPSDTAVILSLSLPAQMSEEEEMNALIAASQTWEPYLYDGEAGNGLWGYKPTRYDTEYSPGSIFWAIFASAQPFDETGHAQVTDKNGRAGVIDQSGHFTPAEGNDEKEAYLITITTDDGVVTSGYRTEWRWVALTRSDPGRPGILLRGEDYDVTGALRRSDGLTVGDDLDAWGKAQDGKPATLTLGRESWECTARYKDYGYQSVLYVEFPPYEAGVSHQPDSDTMNLFRHDWAQEAADKYAAALASLTREERDDPYEEFSETREIVQTLESDRCTVALTRGKFVGYDDYALFLVYKPYAAMGDGTVKGLILPSTVYDKVHAWYKPTDRAPDSLSVSEDGDTLTYVYHFDEALSTGSGVYHEAGTYTYTVELATGELSVTHTDDIPTPPAASGVGGFADVDAADWFAPYVGLVAEKGVMIGTGDTTFSPQKELTQAECLTLAFRLYDLLGGQEHTVEKAPEDWGKLTLTLADGTIFEGYGYQGDEGDPFGWWSWAKNDVQGGYAMVPGEYSPDGEEQRAWIDAHPEAVASNAPASLTLNGETYQGTIWCWRPTGYVLMFQPEEGMSGAVNDRISHAVMREAGPDKWWRNVSYTITRRGLEDIFDPIDFTNGSASRSFFARLIAAACEGHLDRLNTVETIPDLPRESDGTRPMEDEYRGAVYALYEAGILTGVDDEGTFSADATLTRAEAAAMVARAIDKSLRVRAEP